MSRGKIHQFIRTTVAEYLISKPYDGSGIYVIACYPSLGCLYIGRSFNVYERIRQHLMGDKPFGLFMRANMADSCAFGLDVHPSEDEGWCYKYEIKLIEYFRPLFNIAHSS